MNENNVNQTPNTGNAYPQSGQQFSQPGAPYPQSGYPQSGMPYPISGYAEEKKSKTWQIAIVSVVVVLIVALATTLIVILQNRNQMQPQMMPPPPPPPLQNTNVVPGSVVLNGQTVTFDVIFEDGKTYLPMKEFAEAIGYDYVVDGNLIKIIAPTEISILEIDSTSVKLEDQTVGMSTSVEITKAPFKNGDAAYIYARDIALFLKNANVTYNPQMQIVEINIGMGGPGGPPPMGGGMPPQGEQPPQGGQLQQGGQPPKN